MMAKMTIKVSERAETHAAEVSFWISVLQLARLISIQAASR